jgi:hypothetical protein
MKQLMRIVLCVLTLGFSSTVGVQACCCLPCFCAAAKVVLVAAGEVLEKTAIAAVHTELQKLEAEYQPVLLDLEAACKSDNHALSQASINILKPKLIFLNDDNSIKKMVKVLVDVFVLAQKAEATVTALKEGLEKGKTSGKITERKITIKE